MEIKNFLSLRFIKFLSVLFISCVFILLPISDRADSRLSGTIPYGFSGDSQLIWGRMGTSTYAELWDIWGTSGDDIFAVGEDGAIIHYNGSAWRTMKTNSASQLRGVWGSSSSNVYAVGSNGTILHYNGRTWRLAYGGYKPFSYIDVWGSSASDVFVVGDQGKIVHYDGNAWSSMDSDVSPWQLIGVWGSSASDVFVVGLSGKISHYDGNTWSSMDSGTVNDLFGVWGTSATDVYAVGSYSTILHYDGSTWSPMTVGVFNHINAVWGTSATDIFAVGYGPILHYDGSTWSPMAEDIGVHYGVWGSSASNVYAVGYTVAFGTSINRTILYYGDWNPHVLWAIPNREDPAFESITDFVQTVGESKSHTAFRLWCDPLLAAEANISVTSTHPAFSVDPIIETIQCNTYYYIGFAFSPTEPGLVTDKVTVSGETDTISFDIIGNGVTREIPEYWVADLPDIIAWRLTYDPSRDYLYITDSNSDRLIVFSLELRQIVHQIPVGSSPRGMGITPDGKGLYVANSGEYSISQIDLETMSAVRKIPVPPLSPHPQVNPTPYDIAVVDEDTALIGGDGGLGSGGPIYELNLITLEVSPRDDIGGGNRPVLRTSKDLSKTAILLEPGGSPSTVALYDTSSDSSIARYFDIERGLAINKNGNRIATTWFFNNYLVPDLRLANRNLNTIKTIKLVDIPLGIDFHPTGEYIYATGGYRGSSIEEVSVETLIQTRYLDYPMPEGFEQFYHPETLVVSKDGRWVYVILRHSTAPWTPPSRLLAVKINRTVTDEWQAVYNTLFASPSDLELLREYRDEVLSKKARGRRFKKLLYKNSEEALAVLLDNPEMMDKMQALIYTNIEAVQDVTIGLKGTIYNTGEIADFLEAYAQKAPPRLRFLVKVVKRQMLRKQREGKLFFGFRLK
jgi:DNA-binding beta-propeller fold protein YncE